MDKQLLFRPEVLAARSSQWAGSIILLRPVPMRLAAAIAAALTIVLIVYVCFGHYTRKVRVVGEVVPAAGVLKAIAPQFGRVVKRHVQDGDIVKQGQVLYELSAERAGDGGGIDTRIDASLKIRGELLVQELALQTQQLQQREKSLSARNKIIENEMARLDAEISLQQERIASANKMLKRFRSLNEQGFISVMQLSQNENDYNDQLAGGEGLERAKLSMRRELLQGQDEARQIASQVNLLSAQTQRSTAGLSQESAEHQARSRIQVLAPADGTVTALAAESGQTVQVGTALATVIPAGSPLEAHLSVPSNAIGFITQGQTVLLRLSAFPYQKFGQAKGVVLRVEHSPIAQGDAEKGGEPIYRVVVKLSRQSILAYGKEHQYRSGMTFDADIQQDRRRLIEWVMDPIISAAKGRAG